MPKSAKRQNNGANDPSLEPYVPHRGAIFLSEILILSSSISYISMIKKNWLGFEGKILIF